MHHFPPISLSSVTYVTTPLVVPGHVAALQELMVHTEPRPGAGTYIENRECQIQVCPEFVIEIDMARFSPRAQHGLALVEVVLMVAIGGLLVGGVMKGQELITSARVHSLISQQESIKTAYLGFLDRYRAPPGDYQFASLNIAGVAANANGNGNGLITPAGIAGAIIDEHIAAWDHLSKAGYLNGIYNYAAAPEAITSAPTNVYARFLQLTYDNAYGPGISSPSHNLKTGNYVPSDILAEVDRKVDDGVATTGSFRFSQYAGGAGDPPPTGSGACYAAAGSGTWMTALPAGNCGAASLL